MPAKLFNSYVPVSCYSNGDTAKKNRPYTTRCGPAKHYRVVVEPEQGISIEILTRTPRLQTTGCRRG